ncbi:unnamed protein product [Prunus armeniaca]
MSRGATSAASMEFSDDQRCRCTSLRLHSKTALGLTILEYPGLRFTIRQILYDPGKV